VDWSASLYCGITTEWDYQKRTVTLSMPGYVDAILRQLKHPHPKRPQYSPHPHVPITYGTQPQLADEPDDSAPLSPDDPIQPSRIIGKLLYYARAVDSTLGVALSALASEQNKPTQRTRRNIIHLLDYCATNPASKLPFHASRMILHLHSDAGYNNETQARSRSGGHLFLGNHPNSPDFFNGAILNPTHILKHVASSAADAEIGATFVNCREAIPIRITLEEMGYPQPPTPVTLDNTTAVGFANQTIKQRRTKAIDMRYYWLQDQEAHANFHFQWKPSAQNRADYFTKHHPPTHHRTVRSDYVYACHREPPARSDLADSTSRPLPLRGCANPIGLLQCYNVGKPVPRLRAGPPARACQSPTAVPLTRLHQSITSP
jgi:hypothetical protein